MALDDLHARRLSTVAKMFEAALDRMEQVLHSPAQTRGVAEVSRFSNEQRRFICEKIARIRTLLDGGLQHFAVRREKPEPKQMLAAELSTLWVILENAQPDRMKGYGREFSPQDKAEWEKLMQALMHETDMIRSAILKGKIRT